MKRLPSLKYALPLSAMPAVIGLLLVAAGCGSGGGLPQILGGGYTNASLSGQYVVSQTGVAVNQSGIGASNFSETIVFTADGSGHLTVAVDDFNQGGTAFEDTNLSGSYSISKDGTGSITVNFSNGSANYAITMIDDSHFYIIEADAAATASGYGEKQDTTASSSIPTGNFVFKAHNLSSSSRVGGISVAAGALSGNEDRLNLGSQSVSQSLTGSFSPTAAPTCGGRGTLTLTDSTGSSTFCYYVVSGGAAAKFYFLSATGSLEIGQAEAQSGSFSLATLGAGASYVFGSAGEDGSPLAGQFGVHSGGVFSTDGNGNITPGGAVDFVQDTTVNSNLGVTGGNYTLASNGRGTVNLTLSGGTFGQQIFWMVNGSRAYFLVNSSINVEDGTFSQQVAPPLNPVSTQSAFVMDGFDAAYKDRAGAFQPSSSSSFKWNEAANSFDPNPGDLSFGGSPTSVGTTGSFQIGSNGRGTVSVNNVTSNLVFYYSSASSGVMVQEDANIGGSFSTQASQ